MNKQTTFARKMTDTAQANAQELAQMMQKGQTKALEQMTKQMAATMQTATK